MNRLTFLLADDDADDRLLFEKAITLWVPENGLTSVDNGRKAIEYLTNCPQAKLPCAIILDYNMPVTTGPEVLEWICSRPRYDGIHKFIWSTASAKEFRDHCINKGALEYFIKPDSEEKLHSLVKKVVSYCQ